MVVLRAQPPRTIKTNTTPLPSHTPAQAVIPGGSSVPVLNQQDCDDVLMDFDDLKARGACPTDPPDLYVCA